VVHPLSDTDIHRHGAVKSCSFYKKMKNFGLLTLCNFTVTTSVWTAYTCRYFEKIAKFCDESSDRIPVGFILGFYVSLVVSRYWEQLNSLPWPSRMAVFVSSMIHGNDTKGRKFRRTIMRYFSVAYVLTMRNVCPPVRKRFPYLKDIEEASKLL